MLHRASVAVLFSIQGTEKRLHETLPFHKKPCTRKLRPNAVENGFSATRIWMNY